jgi:uncharacterized membrane protein YdjX (TVP38/TMEM64 family)
LPIDRLKEDLYIKAMAKNKRIQGLVGFIAMALSILIIVLVIRHIKNTETFLLSLPIPAPIISIILYGILSVTPVPTDSLTLLNGALFGPYWGIIISWMGNNLAAIIEFVVGHSISNITNFEKKKKKMPWGLNKLPVNSAWFLIIGRFVPSYGSKIVSLAAGIYQVPLWRYTWTTAVTNLIGAIMWVYGGHILARWF